MVEIASLLVRAAQGTGLVFLPLNPPFLPPPALVADVLCGKDAGFFGESSAQDGRPSSHPWTLETLGLFFLLLLIIPGCEQLAALLWIIVPGTLCPSLPVEGL